MIGISDMSDQIPSGKRANSFRDKPYASWTQDKDAWRWVDGD